MVVPNLLDFVVDIYWSVYALYAVVVLVLGRRTYRTTLERTVRCVVRIPSRPEDARFAAGAAVAAATPFQLSAKVQVAAFGLHVLPALTLPIAFVVLLCFEGTDQSSSHAFIASGATVSAGVFALVLGCLAVRSLRKLERDVSGRWRRAGLASVVGGVVSFATLLGVEAPAGLSGVGVPFAMVVAAGSVILGVGLLRSCVELADAASRLEHAN